VRHGQPVQKGHRRHVDAAAVRRKVELAVITRRRPPIRSSAALVPVMFSSVEAICINKMDLAPYLDFDMDLFRKNLAAVNPGVVVFELSARSGDGVAAWVDWVAPRATSA
jgi:hypothetical protein